MHKSIFHRLVAISLSRAHDICTNFISPTLLRTGYSLYGRYFGFKGNKHLIRTLLAGTVFSLNLVEIMLANPAYKVVRKNYLKTLTDTGFTYGKLLNNLSWFVGATVVYELLFALRLYLVGLLSNALANQMKQELNTQYMSEHTSVLVHFLDPLKYVKENENVNNFNSSHIAQITAQDATEMSRSLCQLLDSRTNTLLNFTQAFMALWAMSGVIETMLLGIPFSIAYVPFVCIGYALLYNYFAGILSKGMSAANAIIVHIKGTIQERVAFADMFAEPLEFKGMNTHEQEFIHEQLKLEKNFRQMGIFERFKLRWLNTVHYKIRDVLPITVTALQKIHLGEKVEISDLLDLADYFGNLSNFLTWHADHIDEMISIENSAKRIQAFQRMFKECKDLMKNSKIKLSEGKPYFNGSVWTLYGKKLLHFNKVTLEKGKYYWLQGPNGAGKTTFFRVLAGMWPSGDGQFSRPNNTVFIPQTAVILPGNEPLINNIVAQIKAYDPTFKLTAQSIQSIKKIMAEMGFSQTIIEHLQDCEWNMGKKLYKANWSKSLSGGERACVGLIALFFMKPEMVILDEPFAAMDQKIRLRIQRQLKEQLPNVTLIFTHHGNLEMEGFCDSKLVIGEGSKEVRVVRLEN